MKFPVILSVAALLAAGVMKPAPTAAATRWHDDFLQYRIPVQVEASAAGWCVVPVAPDDLTRLVNRCEDLPFDSRWCAYNFVRVLDVTAPSAGEDAEVEAGFYLIPVGEELVGADALGGAESLEVPTQEGAFYLIRYLAEGGKRAPSYRYDPIFPIGTDLREYGYFVSHEPRILPRQAAVREQLVRSDGQPLKLDLGGQFVGDVQSLSVRRVEIKFLARAPSGGSQNWLIYYQPATGHHLTVPRRRRREVPRKVLSVQLPPTAEKHWGQTAYQLAETDSVRAWFAETTRKLTPSSAPPPVHADEIQISAAANESQSFQLVLSPKTAAQIESVTASSLEANSSHIPAEQITIRVAEYVPVRTPSYITPVTYTGPLADPLTPFRPQALSPQQGNVACWVTVRVPRGAPAGVYRGAIDVAIAGESSLRLPVALEVYDFSLPEYSPFRTSFGGAHVAKATFPGEKTVADYHAAVTKEEVKKVARAYYDAMALNKATPHSVVQFSEIGLNWSPPQAGRDGRFRLDDWDFDEFNDDLRHYVDELKVNAFAIEHTNPTTVTSFHHLPGKPRAQYDRFPPHVVMAWQTFRETTSVGYARRAADAYKEITAEQFDRLVLDYYTALAENLDANGWLDYAYILVDETADRGYGPLLRFMRLLKSHPLTARIQFVWTLQTPAAFRHQEAPGDGPYAFANLLDVYCPETNENAHFWQKYYFSDYGIELRRKRLWNYVTYTSRTVIDTPGINNRIIGLEVFQNGGGGFLNWGSCLWDTPVHGETRGSNPWRDPYSRWGNGSICYFYPPGRDGPVETIDLTITPSLRLETYRESVDDYEYAWILEQLIERGRQRGLDVATEQALLDELDRFFPSATIWSQNDAWYVAYRQRLARAIATLTGRLRQGDPSAHRGRDGGPASATPHENGASRVGG